MALGSTYKCDECGLQKYFANHLVDDNRSQGGLHYCTGLMDLMFARVGIWPRAIHAPASPNSTERHVPMIQMLSLSTEERGPDELCHRDATFSARKPATSWIPVPGSRNAPV